MSDDQSDPLGLEPYLDPEIDFSDVAQPIDKRHALILRNIGPDLLRFQLPWASRSELPLAVDCEINALALLRMQRLFLLEAVRQKLGVNGWDFENFGKSDDPEWLRERDELLADEDFLKDEQDAFFFFVEHFPLIASYAYMITIVMAQLSTLGTTLFEDDPSEKDKFLRSGLDRMMKDLKNEIKRILGTKRRGGSAGKLTDEIRTSLYEYYDDIHLMAKAIKKDYNDTFKKFEKSRHQSGYKFEEWQQFWINHATALYRDYDKDFLASFAEQEHPSASEITYRWLSHRTGGKRSYVESLVKKTRKAAGKTRSRKGTMKNPE